MIAALLVIYLFVVIVMIGAILIQQPRGGGLSATFGGTSSMESILGVRGAPTFFTKLTAVLGALFLILSLTLSFLHSPVREPRSAIERAVQQQGGGLNLPPVTPPQTPSQQPSPTGE